MTAVKAPKRPTSNSTVAAKRRRSLRIADTAVVVGFVASYFTTSSVGLHAVVSLLWTAAVGWHFWIHRKWFNSLAKRLSKKRSNRSRGSALVNVVIAIELTGAVAFGIAAWLGPRSLKDLHSLLANILVAVAIVHLASNVKQLKALIRRRSTVIDRRFRGSADSAQSGYAAGRAASHAEGTVKVDLLDQAPVEQELVVEIDSEERVTVFDGSDVVIEAAPAAELTLEVPASVDVIEEIFTRGPVVGTQRQDRPHCFGCSLEREDGLGIATRQIGTTGIWGTTWTPDESLPLADGFVSDEVLWAALDCPGSFAASDPSGRPAGATGSPSLETMTVEIREKVRVGEQLAVVGWTLSYSGSTVDCGSAIIDKTGRIKAYAHLSHSISDANTPHGQ